MGMRPPPDDTDDEPDAVSFGIAALDAQLEDADLVYPTDAEEVVRSLGDPEIPYNASGSGVRLSTALEETHHTRFENEQELLNALHPVFESYRQNASNGIVAQLRALLPF